MMPNLTLPKSLQEQSDSALDSSLFRRRLFELYVSKSTNILPIQIEEKIQKIAEEILQENKELINKLIYTEEPILSQSIILRINATDSRDYLDISNLSDCIIEVINEIRLSKGISFRQTGEVGIRYADNTLKLPLFTFLTSKDKINLDLDNNVLTLCQAAQCRLDNYIENTSYLNLLIRLGILSNLARPLIISQNAIEDGNYDWVVKDMIEAEESAYHLIGNHAESEKFFLNNQLYRHIDSDLHGNAIHMTTQLTYGTDDQEDYLKSKIVSYFSVFQTLGLPFPESAYALHSYIGEKANHSAFDLPVYFITKLVRNYDIKPHAVEQVIINRLLLVSFLIEASLHSGSEGFLLTSRAQRDTVRLIEKYTLESSEFGVFNAKKIYMQPDKVLFGEYERGPKHPEVFLLHFPQIDEGEADRILNSAVRATIESIALKKLGNKPIIKKIAKNLFQES